jgi:hypothetical protein
MDSMDDIDLRQYESFGDPHASYSPTGRQTRRQQDAERMAVYIKALVDAAPLLTEDQIATLQAIFNSPNLESAPHKPEPSIVWRLRLRFPRSREGLG